MALRNVLCGAGTFFSFLFRVDGRRNMFMYHVSPNAFRVSVPSVVNERAS